MAFVGVRELKNRLSYYLDQVKKGRTIQVAERGRGVAIIIPLPHDHEEEAMWRLVKLGLASWSGGKPQGTRRKITVKGSSMGRAVIDDRR